MKVPYSWLREMVDVTASPADVATAMGVRGIAVEGLETQPDGYSVLDFEVTANRPDCTSIRGLAREVAAAYDLRLQDIAGLDTLNPGTREPFTVEIDRPDAVVLDLGLPRLSGRDVNRELKASAKTRDIPVVVVSGSDVSDLDPKDFACVLKKPASLDAVIGAVKNCLRRRK